MSEYTQPNDELNYRPAMVATGVWVCTGLALDAYLLVKRKNRLISDVIRTKPGRAFLIVFCLHIVNVLGRADPFRAAASVINGRLAATVAAAEAVLTDAVVGE